MTTAMMKMKASISTRSKSKSLFLAIEYFRIRFWRIFLWGSSLTSSVDHVTGSKQLLAVRPLLWRKSNPDTDLYVLFSNNEKIFSFIAPEISVRSTISGIIANEVEKEKGMDGISKLINVDREDRLESYLKATDELVGINKENLNDKVGALIEED